jgi:hypothetical protein
MPIPRVQDVRLGEQLADGLRQLERSLRPDVVRIRWSFGDDWSGDPGIFFRIVLSDAASRRHDLAEFTGHVGGRIVDDLRLAELDYVPYFNFRSESEQTRLQDPEWN